MQKSFDFNLTGALFAKICLVGCIIIADTFLFPTFTTLFHIGSASIVFFLVSTISIFFISFVELVFLYPLVSPNLMWWWDDAIILWFRGITTYELDNTLEGGSICCTSSGMLYKQRLCPLSRPKPLQNFIWWGIYYILLNLEYLFTWILYAFLFIFCRMVIRDFRALAWWEVTGMETLIVQMWHLLLLSFW